MLRLFAKFAFRRAKARERDYWNPRVPFAEMLLSDLARLDRLTVPHHETREPAQSKPSKGETASTR